MISFALGAVLGARRGLAGRRARCRGRSRAHAARRVPYFWLAMLALYVFGFGLGWFPLRHAWDTSLDPAFSPCVFVAAWSGTRCCRR